MNKFILASKSPRRKEILNTVGIEFEVIASEKEEIITSTIPSDIVMELSKQKAEEVKKIVDNKGIYQEYTILAADTIVAIDNNVLGKPKDRQDAYHMIKQIQGTTHSVYTGVTLIKSISNKIKTFYVETKVEVYPMSDKEIENYLDGAPAYELQENNQYNNKACAYQIDWTDKAGAYGIQGKFSAYIKNIIGDYYTVVGLPISRVIAELKDM